MRSPVLVFDARAGDLRRAVRTRRRLGARHDHGGPPRDAHGHRGEWRATCFWLNSHGLSLTNLYAVAALAGAAVVSSATCCSSRQTRRESPSRARFANRKFADHTTMGMIPQFGGKSNMNAARTLSRHPVLTLDVWAPVGWAELESARRRAGEYHTEVGRLRG